MDRLSHYFARLAPRLRPWALRPWLVSGLLVLSVAGGIWWLGPSPAGETYEPLLSGQAWSPRELAKMTAAFRKAGLPESQIEGGRVCVPAGRREAYLAALEAANALPADVDEALERYVSKSSPFASQQQTEQGYKYATQIKLARIVAGMQGIETASVQFDEIKQPGFPPTTEKRALVAVRPRGDQPLEDAQIEAIRDTVAGSIGGLDRSRVTVTDLAAGRAYPGSPDPHSPHGAAQSQAATQTALERDFRQKIEHRLAKYPDVVVAVSVHGPPVTPSDRFRRGAEAAPLSPALVTASIDIPKSYFRKVWSERNGHTPSRRPEPRELQALEAEVKQTITRAVAAMLPPPAVRQRDVPQVTVTSYDDMSASRAAADSPTAALAAALARPLPLLSIGVACTVGLGLWQSRRRRRTPVACGASPLPEPLGALTPAAAAASATTEPGDAWPNTSLRGELQLAIQRDPVAAAGVLAQWMGDAA
jgi:hypothetical protein